MSAIRISLLEMHAAHACNLTCESCSHFSNSGHQGSLALDDARDWMQGWQERIAPRRLRILGGEPTLNPRLPELLELAAQHWPRSKVSLVTNGFFLHRHPRLPEVLSRHQMILRLTQHHQSAAYGIKYREITSLLDRWRKDHPFELELEEAYTRWTRRHRGFGSAVLPYEDADPSRSWKHCAARNCVQLFRGRLWKCSPITYLKLQKETFAGLSAKWDPYLAYEGLGTRCSDAELLEFIQRGTEEICSMCPADPEPFDKPSPLIPRGALRKRLHA
jgi:hypothetical protein